MARITDYAQLSGTAPADLLLVVDVSDTSMAPTGTDKKMTLAQLLNAGLAPSGDTTGVTDTAAINAMTAAGGTANLTAGTFWTTGVTLPGGARLLGAGAGQYGTASPASQRTIIKLAAGANADVITVPAGNAYGRIEDLEIDGNKTAQTTGGKGITFPDAGAAEECEWQLRRVQVHDAWGIGIYVGNNRQAVYGEHVIVNYSGQHGVQIVGSDSTWVKLLIGNSGSGWKGLVAGGWVTQFLGGEVWNTPAGIGCVVVAPENMFIGMSLDRNGQNGMLIDSGATATSVIGCTFHSNSQQADNTYSDIKVNVAGAFSIAGCSFAPLDGGISFKRKYCIETSGNAVAFIGNGHVAAATGTGFTDNVSRLIESIDLVTQGAGLAVAEGSNCKQGTTALVAGTKVVANTAVTANSRIFLTSNADGGTPGWLRVSARTAGTSFTITSSSGTDTSTVAYEIFEPG